MWHKYNTDSTTPFLFAAISPETSANIQLNLQLAWATFWPGTAEAFHSFSCYAVVSEKNKS